MGPIWDAELRVWDAKNFGPVSPGTHRNKFVKKSLFNTMNFHKQRAITAESMVRYGPLSNLKKDIMVLNNVIKFHKIQT